MAISGAGALSHVNHLRCAIVIALLYSDKLHFSVYASRKVAVTL